jgi:hypothetical protein
MGSGLIISLTDNFINSLSRSTAQHTKTTLPHSAGPPALIQYLRL